MYRTLDFGDSTYVQETALTFSYPYEHIEKARELKRALDENNVKYVFSESTGYYNHTFVVRKSGYKWEEIMILINSIKAAKYTKKKFWFSTKDGKIATLFIGNKEVI